MRGSEGSERGCLVSVIIPTLNEESWIGGCIDAARRGYEPRQVEVVVADGGSSDGTARRIPADVVFLTTSRRGRAIQLNAGASVASGRILVFCHADTRLPTGWREAVTRTLALPGAVGGVFQPRFEPQHGPTLRLLNSFTYPANWRLMYGDQCQFTHRATFERVGGFPALRFLEDLALAKALAAEGRMARIRIPAVTSSRRFRSRGALRQILVDAVCVAAYLAGVNPDRLEAWYPAQQPGDQRGSRAGGRRQGRGDAPSIK